MITTAHANLTGAQVRELCRRGQFTGPTAGVALGYTQVNLVILRADVAGEFEEFCRLNPKPCPLLEVTRPGQYEPVHMAPGGDVRTDLPRYRVFRHGECIERPTTILSYWRDPPVSPLVKGGSANPPVSPLVKGGGIESAPVPAEAGGIESASVRGKGGSMRASPLDKGGLRGVDDFVAFLIGCSFTFETALLKAGIPVRHIEEGRNVPMYRTSLACKSAGRFSGPLVVSMRPMTPQQAERAAEITARLPRVHGAPIHVGNPQEIGITDIRKPDYGDAVTIRDGEVPVFWACGVTPMEAILRAKPDLAITHEPGHMLVTDVRDESLFEQPIGGQS